MKAHCNFIKKVKKRYVEIELHDDWDFIIKNADEIYEQLKAEQK